MPGGWGDSNRSASLPRNWNSEIVPAVKARSGGRCEWKVNPAAGNYRRCPNPANGGVDHYKGRDYHELDGLRDSCHDHHSKKSSKEGNDAKRAKAAARYRPAEEHPGLIRRG